jgi:adenine-specific DNA methylase
MNSAQRVLSNAEKAVPASSVAPHLMRHSAIIGEEEGIDFALTDPPYYDAIPYSDLMDYFYIWLRRALLGASSEIDQAFGNPLAPKWDEQESDGEIIDDSSRHNGDAKASRRAYEDGMYRSFRRIQSQLSPNGRLVVVFANKKPEAWETLVDATIRAGFCVTGSWPIVTEMPGGLRNLNRSSLASSIWLVCKKRPDSASTGWDNRVLAEMRTRITERLRDFWDAGIRGPDFVWSATGPALEAYSRYPLVKKASEPGQALAVGEFLRHVRRMVVDFVVGRILSSAGSATAESLDDVTTYYLLHRQNFRRYNRKLWIERPQAAISSCSS